MKKRKEETEKIFIKYANTSLKDNPEIFQEIFDQFKNLFQLQDKDPGIPFDGGGSTTEIINYFSQFVNWDDFEKAKKYIKKRSWPKSPPSADGSLEVINAITDKSVNYFKNQFDKRNCQIAFEAIYGYRDNACVKKCFGETRIPLLGKENFSVENHLKCFQCDQIFFNYMLEGIAEGKEYREKRNDALCDYLTIDTGFRTNEFIKIVNAPSGSPFKDTLGKEVYFGGYDFYNMHTKHPENYFRQLFLFGIIKFSLVEFLQKDRRKLKRCQKCKNFYIAKTMRPSTFCSDKCRLAWHNRKRIKSGEAKEYKRKRRREGIM
jgi:hypothetical protein